MEHYVCKGTCGGVSETPGVCQAENCPRHHAPLEKCECEDGRHEPPEKTEAAGARKKK
ncbi:MAG: hypothetical protein Q8P88_01020 [Candidatus Jorgensenbacteria bacterium]|nr:hypothetical protein [Candidatus Jorgensenbacteria bacterium]